MTYLFTGFFILLDLVTGLIKAFKEKTYTSSIMREGLYHKAGAIIIVVLATLIDEANVYMDLGFTFPLAVPACAYISIMEIGSIIENVGEINPQLMPSKIKEHFLKLKEREV